MPDKVFVIPGFLGSTLQQQNPRLPDRTVWYSTVEFATYGADNLDLAADGISPGPLAGNPCLPTTVIGTGYYSALLTQLTNDKWDVRVFTYDWRKALLLNAVTLSNYLFTESAGQPFWVFAHSMGGLLARAAYRDWTTTGRDTSKWQRSVYAATPHGGSYVAAAFLAGAPISVSGWNLFWLSLGSLVPGRSLNSLIRSRQDRTNQVVASWPGLHFLLPSTTPPWSADDPLAPELFMEATYRGQNRYVTQARLDSGLTAIEYLHGLNALPRPAETCLVGYDQNTPSKLRATSAISEDADYEFTMQGDGVVTVDRATLPGTLTKSYPVNHQRIVQSGIVLQEVTTILKEPLPGDATIPVVPTIKPEVFRTDPPLILSTIPFPALQRRGDP